jgi:hypothetical protein
MALPSPTIPPSPRLTPHQGIVYDVTGNKAYQPGGAYNGKPYSDTPLFHIAS